MRHKITIKQLAQQLHVSPSTVSRALQDHPEISPATKKAVWELASKLDYHPNHFAAGLRKNKTFTLGVIVPEIVHFFFSSVISGIEDIAYDAGYKVIICQSSENHDREVMNINALITGRVDGILMSVAKDSSNSDHIRSAAETGIPLVFFDRICEELNSPRVIVDDYQGALQATGHLAEQGCRRIAHLAGPDSLVICRDRKRGYSDALIQHGIALDPELVVMAHNKNEVPAAVDRLMSLPDPPDAFFTVNDNVAVSALITLKRMNYQIPRDVAIVGFTDDPSICTIVDPAITSVHQPAYEMGLASARILLDYLHTGIDKAETIVMPTHLVIRESSQRKKFSRQEDFAR